VPDDVVEQADNASKAVKPAVIAASFVEREVGTSIIETSLVSHFPLGYKPAFADCGSRRIRPTIHCPEVT